MFKGLSQVVSEELGGRGEAQTQSSVATCCSGGALERRKRKGAAAALRDAQTGTGGARAIN